MPLRLRSILMNSKKAVKSLSALPGAFMIPKQASITMIESSAAEAILENPFRSFEINLPYPKQVDTTRS